MKTAVAITIIMVVAVSMLGCATMDSRWQQAISKNTISVYENFQRDYPNSKYSTLAKEKIDDLRWQKAFSANTLFEYEMYLIHTGEGRHALEAKEKIETFKSDIESREWEKAKSKESVYAIENFFRSYPNSNRRSEGDIYIQELEWKSTKRKEDYDEYEFFLKKFPNGPFSALAREELKKFAKVTVSAPNRVTLGKTYEIVYQELNGIAVVFTRNNTTFWDSSGEKHTFSHDAVINWTLPAKGKKVHKFVAPLDWRNFTAFEEWLSGGDFNGHKIKVKFFSEINK